MWSKPHTEDERDMLEARLKAYRNALKQILELADGHHEAEEALAQIGDLAELALTL